MDRFMSRTLVRSPFYAPLTGRSLSEYPLMNKQLMMENFDAINTRSIKRDDAFALAEEAERSRDFKLRLGGVSVGLSTGTSGKRALFLTSDTEQMRWAGIILARMLPGSLIARHRIALFLRANNNLYESVSGQARIQFAFFDLMKPLPELLTSLRDFDPTLVIAPAQVLRQLARLENLERRRDGTRPVAPARVVSVAEVLFDDDRAEIERVFARKVDQIYQCTEGLLAYTCRAGRLHLNETFLHVEPEWIDEGNTRFLPIITDFSRETQPIVRYRLDDVLTIDRSECVCGSHERVIARIEGRADDILVLPHVTDGHLTHLMPDFVARALTGAGGTIEDFRIEQISERRLQIYLAAVEFETAQSHAKLALATLMRRHGLDEPEMHFAKLPACDLMSKRRRVRRNAAISL